MNWDTCKKDIRTNLFELIKIDSLILQIIGFTTFLIKVSKLELFVALLYYFIVFVIAFVLTILYTIIIHFIFPENSSPLNSD